MTQWQSLPATHPITAWDYYVGCICMSDRSCVIDDGLIQAKADRIARLADALTKEREKRVKS